MIHSPVFDPWRGKDDTIIPGFIIARPRWCIQDLPLCRILNKNSSACWLDLYKHSQIMEECTKKIIKSRTVAITRPPPPVSTFMFLFLFLFCCPIWYPDSSPRLVWLLEPSSKCVLFWFFQYNCWKTCPEPWNYYLNQIHAQKGLLMFPKSAT